MTATVVSPPAWALIVLAWMIQVCGIAVVVALIVTAADWLLLRILRTLRAWNDLVAWCVERERARRERKDKR